jgi:putative ABC transport system substrate-binding protein
MAYQADQGELGRHLAVDVHEILNGTKPGDIPIYLPTKFELIVNPKATNALGSFSAAARVASQPEVAAPQEFCRACCADSFGPIG